VRRHAPSSDSARTALSARASKWARNGGKSQDQPSTSPPSIVSIVTGPLFGTNTSTATRPSRIRKKWSACCPSRKMKSPGWNTTFATQPVTVSRFASAMPVKKG